MNLPGILLSVALAVVAAAILAAVAALGLRLRRSEARYQNLIAAAPDAIVVADLRTNLVVEANLKAEELWRRTRAQILGSKLDDLFAASGPDVVRQLCERLSLQGRWAAGGLQVGRLDGSIVPVDVTASVSHHQHRSLLHAIVRDITTRKRSDEALAESERRMRMVVEGVRDYAIFSLDAGGQITIWPAAAQATWGYDAADVLGRHVSCLYEGGYAAIVREAVETLTVDGRFEHEGWQRRKDGVAFWAHTVIRLVEGEGGRRRGYVNVTRDTTALHTANEERDRLAVALGATVDLVGLTDAQGRMLYMNRAGRRMLGLGDDETLDGRSILEFAPSTRLSELAVGLRTALIDGVWKSETALKTRAGAIVPVSQVLAVHRSEDGSPGFLSMIARDVTDRKRYEALLQIRTQQQAAVAELGLLALTGLDVPRLMTETVRIVRQTLDIDCPAVLELSGEQSMRLRAGAGWRSEWYQRDLSFDETALAARTLREGAPLVVTNLERDPRAGATTLLRNRGVVSSITVVIQGRPRPFGVLGAYSTRPRDFTEDDVHFVQAIANVLATALDRRVTEDRRRESEARYGFLYFNNPLPMWVVDRETGRFLTVNAAALAAYGYSEEEFLALTVDDIRAPDGDAGADALVGDTPSYGGRSRHRTRDGSIITVAITSYPLEFAGRAATVGIAIDTTERERLEQQLVQAQKMEAIGRLAGGVAHDFNNLLTVITGQSERLLLQLRSGDPLAASGQAIYEAADRAATLTRQLLAFSRRQMIAPEVVDVNVVVGDLERLLQRLIGEDIDLSMACTSARPMAKADPSQLEQVLLNLAVNARDAMPGGGRLVLGTSDAELDPASAERQGGLRTDRWVVLSVTDTGVGMDVETQAHIFEPFFTTKDKGKGTGLGLAMAYGIVKQSGGFIRVQSSPGHGTTFDVFLPAVDDAPSVRTADDGAVARQVARGSERVLVVEDEESVRHMLCEVLQGYGYNVIGAADGAEALGLLRNDPGFSLLVTDMIMPQMPGWALAREAKRHLPDLRILYMSGYTDHTNIERDLAEGFADFLSKPFRPFDFAQKVRAVLDRRAA